ncbi:PorV/PorQ family protein [Algoriphagus mannitolivorans]|uniref:hypothetical protein n=1 Tax=Algoriphagus mannitolivorans TaxID=226504 RepID=UPI00047AAB9E|nr:hypothetical protein [Algoriphagus mannitolivorans]
MKPLFFLCFWGLLVSFSFCQTDPFSQAQGARSQGMGNLKVNLSDSWSYFNHIGALDRMKETQIVSGYDHRYGLKELGTFSLASGIKTEVGTVGLGISRFGGELFNQHLVGAGFSNTFGIMSFGAKIDWLQTQIEGFGTGNSLLISLGGKAELGPKTYFGANISNINRAKFSKNTGQRIPTFIQMGISYLPSKSVGIYTEIEKEADSPALAKMALEYLPSEWLILRTGISSNPARISFGFGAKNNRMGFDYAFGQNSNLGSSHHFSLNLNLKEP